MKKNILLRYCKHLGLLIPFICLLFPFIIWLLSEYYNYKRQTLVMLTSFVPMLSYIIGLLIGILQKSIDRNKNQYIDGANDSYH